MSARGNWNVCEADFPASGSQRQKLGFVLKYATLSPTEINWQPWEFRLAETYFELICKADPALEAVDPDGREVMIGCGSALYYLKLALKHFGCLGRVELFPDLSQPMLAARIHFGYGSERDAQEKSFFEAMIATRVNSSSLGESPVSQSTLAVLSQTLAGERGWLEFTQSKMSHQRVLEITQAVGDRSQSMDGLSGYPSSVATRWESPRWPRPLFAFGSHDDDREKVMVEPPRQFSIPDATLAVVKTKTDDKHGWLAAGQTMARAVVQANVLGLSWAFFDQVRRREVRAALRSGIGHKGFAQVILRFGSLMSGEAVRLTQPTVATATFR